MAENNPESPNKFTEFVDFIERGTKDLENQMDEIMRDAAPALKEGEENMNRMREHVGRLKSGIQKVKDFNNKMGNR